MEYEVEEAESQDPSGKMFGCLDEGGANLAVKPDPIGSAWRSYQGVLKYLSRDKTLHRRQVT